MIFPAFLAPMAKRNSREPEATEATPERLWEAAERFAGELALRDLSARRDDTAGAGRVVARYLVLRAARLHHGAAAAVSAANREADWAREYIAEVPDGDERRAFGEILEHASWPGSPVLWHALEVAAAAAGVSGHDAGAYALRRYAFAVQREHGAWADAARSARAIEQLVRAAGDARRARLWGGRARRLVRRRLAPRRIMESMAESYTREERRQLAAMLEAAEPLSCPACGERVVDRSVPVRQDVAYVRRRVLLLCTACGRSTAVDVSAGGQP